MTGQDDRRMRVQLRPGLGDVWLHRAGDRAVLDVPGGRVTLESRGYAESGLHYAHMTYEPIRSGLVRFGCGPSAPETGADQRVLLR